jgi:CRISPR/Cas system-associated endonuclease Cas1
MTRHRVTAVAKLIVISSVAFVLDLMELHRPLVDREVLEFVNGHVFDPADFVIRPDGVYRLNPEMAKAMSQIVAQS